MDRRESIKSMILGGMAGGLVLHGCKPQAEAEDTGLLTGKSYNYGRTPAELETLAKLDAETFFTGHEMDTLNVLCALILPANDNFGSATDAGSPEFIEFMDQIPRNPTGKMLKKALR